jgi:hypothetical protein
MSGPLRERSDREPVGEAAMWDFAPRGELELRHGYTLDDLRRLAGGVVKYGYRQAGDPIDRLEIAWSAIAGALYASESKPTTWELRRAAMDALVRYDADDRHHRGVASSGPYAYTGFGSAPRFQAYWGLAQTTPSPEDGVVERVALAQIWPRLTDGQRRALLALAAFGDYAEAARALGMAYGGFTRLVRAARQRFLELWHQGETPSRIWGRDRRTGRREAARRRPVTVRAREAARRRQQRAQRREAQQ